MTAFFRAILIPLLLSAAIAKAAPCDDALSTTKPLPNSYAALKGLRGIKPEAALKNPALAPYLDMSRPLKTDAIKVSANRSRLFFTQDRFVKCGMCAQMARTSVLSIVLPLLAYRGEFTPEQHEAIDHFAPITSGKAVFIFVKGELVGAINAAGSERNLVDTNGRVFDVIAPSFLALNDVTDENGRIVLGTGGVYEMTRDFYEDYFLPTINAQGPYTSIAGAQGAYNSPNARKYLSTFNIGIINVTKLQLYPKTFILNDKALPFNQRQFETIFGEKGDTSESQNKLWRAIVAALHRLRATVEDEYRRDPKLTQMRHFFSESYKTPDEENAPAFQYIPEP